MIAGHVTIEDSIIHFQWEDGAFQFTACDALTGRQYGMQAKPDAFVQALALALHPDPDSLFDASFWDKAETIMEPPIEGEQTVRWIP